MSYTKPMARKCKASCQTRRGGSVWWNTARKCARSVSLVRSKHAESAHSLLPLLAVSYDCRHSTVYRVCAAQHVELSHTNTLRVVARPHVLHISSSWGCHPRYLLAGRRRYTRPPTRRHTRVSLFTRVSAREQLCSSWQ